MCATAARAPQISLASRARSFASVALVLGFIGGKILIEYLGVDIPTSTSLGIVVAILGTGVAASLLSRNGDKEA